MAEKRTFPEVVWITCIGIGMWLIGFIYRMSAPIVVLGALYGAYFAISPMPTLLSTVPIVASAQLLLGWMAKNWLPFCAIVVVWNSVRTAINARVTNKNAVMVLVASAAILDYFGLEVETDDMRMKKDVGPWEHWKALVITEALFYVFDISRKPDAVSARAVRQGKFASFQSDCANGDFKSSLGRRIPT